jgi:myo-inositol-1-phosphate synthase
LTASLIANKRKLSWKTKRGEQKANYFGSFMLASTTKIGLDKEGEEVYMPLKDMLPMLNPEEIVLGGWDISGANLAEAMERACVLEPDLQRQVYDEMVTLKPLPSIYYSDFIALNQSTRANNLLDCGGDKQKELQSLRDDIRLFKQKNELEKVIVLWTANTERFADLIKGVNDTSENLLRSISENQSEISPSSMFAVAAILENCPFINGSPQNTFVPGVIELAMQRDVYIGLTFYIVLY